MKRIAATLLALTFAAHPVAAKELRDRKPVIDQTSERSLADIQKCLTERWVQTIDFPVGTVPMQNGIIYNTRSPVTAFAMAVEVQDQGTVRRVMAWVKTAPVSFVNVGNHLAKVRGCL